jgi:hypothetical protein
MLDEDGCAKRTASLDPMSNVSQLIAARSVPCVMSVFEPERLTLACPATTCSPVGPAKAGPTLASSAKATALATGRIEVRKEIELDVRRSALTRSAPLLRANSEEILTLPCSS